MVLNLNQPIHIISDLHLCASRPDLFALFAKYMREIAIGSKQLYVLGDLFEVWIGDDCLEYENPNSPLYSQVIALFKEYSEQTGELFFMHGNRDFLLGKDFATATGGRLLEDPYFIDWQKHKVALMHGDSLCTDDQAYQEFRKMVRNPEWQTQILAQSIPDRIKIASGLREQSEQAQSKKSIEIMDVNLTTVNEFFKESNVDWLIHGHTHRQATHPLLIDDKARQRVVLSDWGKQGFYLSITDGSIEAIYFS